MGAVPICDDKIILCKKLIVYYHCDVVKEIHLNVVVKCECSLRVAMRTQLVSFQGITFRNGMMLIESLRQRQA